MKKIQFPILVILLFCSFTLDGFAQSVDTIIVDKIKLGMELQAVKNLYPKASFYEEPLYKYGIDSEVLGTLVVQKTDTLFFLWSRQEKEKIKGVVILSENIIIDKSIHVGMEISLLAEKFSSFETQIDVIDESFEYFYNEEKGYRVDFVTNSSNRVSEYIKNTYPKEFLRVKRPEATVDRITIRN